MLFNENQEEVEGAMTPEEVEEKLQETKDQATDNATKQVEEIEEEHKQEIKELEDQIKEKEEEVTKEQDKDKNFTNLRGKTKEKDEAISKLTEEIEKLKGTVEEKMTEFQQGATKEKVEDIIDGIVGSDKELKEKVMFHYNSFEGEPKTKEELLERINNSHILATGNKLANPLTGAAISSVGGSGVETKEDKGKMSGKEKEVAKALGINDADLKKHNLI